jgi:hypothetical protein
MEPPQTQYPSIRKPLSGETSSYSNTVTRLHPVQRARIRTDIRNNLVAIANKAVFLIKNHPE